MAYIIPVKGLKDGTGKAISLGEMVAGDLIGADYLDAQRKNLYGTYADRPAAAAGNAGALYFASNTLECYRSTGSAWVLVGRGGAELGHAERTTPYSTTVNTFADVPGLAVDYVAGEGATYVTYGATARTLSAGNTGVLALFVDGTQVGQVLYNVAAFLTQSSGVRISGKTPGATVQVRVRARQANAPTEFNLFGDATDRPFLHVVTG